jgi:hypothetical protein
MSTQNFNPERRNFFKYGAAAIASLVLAPALRATGSLAFGADAQKPLTEDDTLAKTMGYHKDAKKVDVKKWAKKGGADGKDQSCKSCMFFTAGSDGKTGKCQIFPNNTVNMGGWCNSWAKKTT